MVTTTRFHRWCVRLVNLRRDLDRSDNRGEAWLFRIRLKIIGYLITRYADTAIANQPVDASVDAEPQQVAASGSAPPASAASLNLDCDNPPKMREDLRPILDDLHETNDDRRELEGVYRRLDHAWMWWRETLMSARPSSQGPAGFSRSSRSRRGS